MAEHNRSYTGTWVSVSDKLPETGRTVIAYCVDGRYKYKATAFYVAEAYTIEVDSRDECGGDDELTCDYCEKTDQLFLKPGWYEIGLNMYKSLDGVALAWTEFPPIRLPSNDMLRDAGLLK